MTRFTRRLAWLFATASVLSSASATALPAPPATPPLLVQIAGDPEPQAEAAIPEPDPEDVKGAAEGDPWRQSRLSWFLSNRAGPGDLVEALDLARKSLRGYEQVEGESYNVAIVLGMIGNIAYRLAYYGEAEAALERQVLILSQIRPGSTDLAWAIQQRGINLQGLSRYADAIPYFTDARAILTDLYGELSSEVADTWLNEGISLEGLKRHEEAIAAYDRAEAAYDAALGPLNINSSYALNNTAWVYRKIGKHQQSYDLFQLAKIRMEAGLGRTHPNTTKVYINLGIMAQLLGRQEEAIRWSMQALGNLKRDLSLQLDDQRWCYDTLAKAFAARGDRKRAILFAKLAINAQQQIRSNNREMSRDELKELKAEWSNLYQHLADLLIAEGRISEAQAVLDMEKDEELFEFLRRDSAADPREERALLTPREETGQAEIDALLERPIAAATQLAAFAEKQANGALSAEDQAKVAELEAALDTAYSDFMTDVDAFLEKAEVEDSAEAVDTDSVRYTADIQEELRQFDGRAAMLQIASLKDAVHIFLTVPEASVHREVKIAREDLSREVFAALQAIDQRSPDALPALERLYERLVAPVEDDIRASGADTLMLNLQGFLRYVPFAALNRNGRYLVEDYALSLYTPAARTRFEATDRGRNTGAGFGVTRAHPGFSPLPGVRREMQAIFGSDEAGGALEGAPAIDDAFTRQSFTAALKSRPEIVHIASHFKLVPGRETDSFLLMGDGSALSLAEIRTGRGFRFGGVDLLTLSACQTARGGDSEGDEVESFGSLAQMNGASAVMATLWPVADDATAAIMRDFYARLTVDGLDKAQALRRAQLDFIGSGSVKVAAIRGLDAAEAESPPAPADHSHPYYWSPFILMGNWL